MYENAIKSCFTYSFDAASSKIHIGYGIDDNYVRALAASITSICSNNQKCHFTFHVLAVQLTNHNKNKLCQLAKKLATNIILYLIDSSFLESLPTFVHLPLATYFRFLLPYILKDEKYIYYLDADIICLRSADHLFNENLVGNIIAAVPDLDWMNRKRCRVLGLTDHIYFNAGVIVIDIALWNKYAVMDKVLTLLKRNPTKFRYLDQDALNVVLQKKVHYLPKIYNYIDADSEDKSKIVLLHFAAHPKPWHIAWPLSTICNDFNRNLYKHYEDMTPWQDEPLQLPHNYKEMKIYARALKHSGKFLTACKWYFKYIWEKCKGKFS